MKFNECDFLLSPEPVHLETGYERFDSGVLHVACRTDLHNCSGEMVEWWFASRPSTQQYIWWHPVDHVSSEWSGGQPGTHVGSTHLVEEFLTGLPAGKLSIQFRDSTEFFDTERYRAARSSKDVTAAICGRIGQGHEPSKDGQGRILGGRLIHVARDTDWGCVLRSHFFLGEDLPSLGQSPAEIAGTISDAFGRALLQHCYNEFTYLSRFLPALFIAENRKIRPITRLPW